MQMLVHECVMQVQMLTLMHVHAHASEMQVQMQVPPQMQMHVQSLVMQMQVVGQVAPWVLLVPAQPQCTLLLHPLQALA